MFEMMRPYVIITNLVTLAWFIALQYYRFRAPGKACSGEFLTKMPENYSSLYLADEGKWFTFYVISHYCVYIFQKIICICITNRHETEFEKRRSLLQNKV